jgi:hypothetical protein
MTDEAAPVAIISYELWRRDFGGDPGGGRNLTSNRVYSLIGIMPRHSIS